MFNSLRTWLMFVVVGLSYQGAAQAGELVLFSQDGFRGRELTLREVTPTLDDLGFNDRASSMVVRSGRWEVCEHAEFRGVCAVFEPGEYRTLEQFNNRLSSAREIGVVWDRADRHHRDGARGALELFAQPGLSGNSIHLVRDTPDLVPFGFNDRAKSAVIAQGTWQLCSDAEFRGMCATFGPGRYPELGAGLNGRVSSARLETDGAAPRADQDAMVLLFEYEGSRGRSIGLRGDQADFVNLGFNDMAVSIVIQHGHWEFCTDSEYRGVCRVYRPGQYSALEPALQRSISSVRQVRARIEPPPFAAPVELFSEPDFRGARLPVRRDARTLDEFGFNDRVGSILISVGEWEFCEHADFRGQCVIYGSGRHRLLGSMTRRISSLRQIR